MTKLEDLINSLASVIVRYHDTQKDVTKLIIELDQTLLRNKSRKYAIDIMQNTEVKYDQRLTKLIDVCTKKYSDRKPFLKFLLKEIVFLKEQLDRKIPYTSQELELLNQQISQFFIDSQQLLKNYKGTIYRVTCSSLNDKTISHDDLNGLINDAYYGNHFCNSGDILFDEILSRLHITPDYTDEEIKEIASAFCLEHQNALLVSQLKAQQLALKNQKTTLEHKVSELESDKSALTLQLLKRTEINQVQERRIEELHRHLEEHQIELQKAQSEVDRLKKQKIEPQEIHEKTIEGLRYYLNETQTELQKTQSEFERFKKKKTEETMQLTKRIPPLHPMYGNLTPFYLLNQQKGQATFFKTQLFSETHTLDEVDEIASPLSN